MGGPNAFISRENCVRVFKALTGADGSKTITDPV